MSDKLLIRTSRAWMAPALAVALLALPVHASKKDDDYKRAQQAVATGDVITAARLFCALADEDSKFKDVVSQCEVYKNETKRQRNVEQKRLDDARAAAKAGKLDEAEDLLRKIKIADLADQAKDELGRIAGLRSQQNAAASAERSFQQAVQAYNSNDFQRARDLFGGVTGPAHAGEVRSYLDKIDNYQRAMASARRMQDAKDYKGAAAMYQEAAGIKSDGPNDPRASAAQMSQLATQAAAPQPTSAANPTTTATAKPAESSPKPSADHGAVRAAPARVDTAALMRDADAAQAKGDLGAAKGKYLAILAADPQNAQARVALNQVSALSQSSGKRQSAGAEADVMLAKAIGEYYNCLLEDADVHIRDYLAADGAKRGLAYFYQGASRVTRYYLNGAQDRQLLDDARSAFVKAKQVADFHPPDAKLVSPRVIKAYGDAR